MLLLAIVGEYIEIDGERVIFCLHSPALFASPASRTKVLSSRFLSRVLSTRSRADRSVVIMHATQVVLIDGTAHSPAQSRTCNLVEAKMYSAVNARVGDVVGNLLK
jgi:hypothetical protein